MIPLGHEDPHIGVDQHGVWESASEINMWERSSV